LLTKKPSQNSETGAEDAAAKAAKQERLRANLERWKLKKQQEDNAAGSGGSPIASQDGSQTAFHTFDYKTVKKRIEASKNKQEKTTLDGDAMVAVPSKAIAGLAAPQSISNGVRNMTHVSQSKVERVQSLIIH
jgi:hypothetical protein